MLRWPKRGIQGTLFFEMRETLHDLRAALNKVDASALDRPAPAIVPIEIDYTAAPPPVVVIEAPPVRPGVSVHRATGELYRAQPSHMYTSASTPANLSAHFALPENRELLSRFEKLLLAIYKK